MATGISQNKYCETPGISVTPTSDPGLNGRPQQAGIVVKQAQTSIRDRGNKFSQLIINIPTMLLIMTLIFIKKNYTYFITRNASKHESKHTIAR